METTQDEIRRWLSEQQEWMQDAAQRILAKGSVSVQEVREIADLLKSPAGRVVTNARSFNEMVDKSTVSVEMRLVKVDRLRGIENLAPRRPLEFGAGNLVVIYGHNGAGKSGYTRIFKRASGKTRSAVLRTNVFESPASDRGCEITISKAGANEALEWHPDDAPLDALRGLDIFDTDEATHYLSKESPASYTPPALSMFGSLVLVCDRVKEVLQAEQDALSSKLPQIPTKFLATLAGMGYQAITAKTTPAQIVKLKVWTERDQAALDALRSRVAQVDPASVAKQRRATKRQAEKVIDAVNREAEAYGAVGIERARSMRSDAANKRKAAEDAGLLGSAKLEGIGSDSWILLWQAARAYSLVAYPSQEFPVTDAGSLCVLCHQELSIDAQQRFADFERFVAGTLAAEADAADLAYKKFIEGLPAAKDEEAVRTQCEAGGLSSPELLSSLIEFWRKASEVRAALVGEESEREAQALELAAVDLKAIRFHCDQLEEQAAQFDLDASSEQRPQLEAEKPELEARLWMSQQGAAIDEEVSRLKVLKELDDFKALASSRKVTLKASELSAKVITEDYVRRFNAELQALGAARLKVGLVKTRAERGKTLHQLQLIGAKQAGSVELILSEGERRVISLAAFLADVVAKDESTPFIFDDPISSLDQTWEELTAARLISLSLTRQVVVFTHRLSMLSHFADSAEVAHIRVEPWGAGETGEVPLFGKSPEKALNDLKGRRLPQAKKLLDEAGSEAYYPLAKAICSDFRILIERFVETYVLAEVVQRHRREVNTKGKLHNLLKLRKDDCDLVNCLMSKYSKFEHSQPDEAPVDLPTVDELSGDMQSLLSWLAEFKSRPSPAI